MPPSKSYSPPISELINPALIPGNLRGADEIIGSILNGLLSEVKYKNLTVESSRNGDAKFYGITLLTKEISTPPVPGLGVKIVFSPSISDYSIHEISMDWRWPIQRYASGFSLRGFSEAPEAFLDILLEIADIEDEQEFIDSIAAIFLSEPDVYEVFFDNLKLDLEALKANSPSLQQDFDQLLISLQIIRSDVKSQLTQSGTNLFDVSRNYKNSTIISGEITAIQASIDEIQESTDIDFDPYKTVVTVLLKDIQAIDQKFDQLIALFQTWLGNITKEDVDYLLVPHFKIALQNIEIAMEFPRKWLVPVDKGTFQQLPGNSALTYTVGNLEYSTDDGFAFLGQDKFQFTFSEIAETGLTIGFESLKVDLSRTTNIPEADMDGRPVEFMGAYALKATIGLPQEWFKQKDGQTLGIIGRNILIGTGGVSGVVGLEALGNGTTIADDELIFTLGKKKGTGVRRGFLVGFKELHLEWRQNTLIDSSLKGSLTLPKVQRYDPTTGATSTDPLKINIEMGFQNDGDFQIAAKPEGGLSFAVKDAFYVSVDGLTVAKNDNEIYAETSGRLGFDNNEILKTFFKKPFEIKKLRVYSDGNIEFEGGSIPLPFGEPVSFGPIEVTVSNLTFGADEREYKDPGANNNVIRKYKFFGFSAQVGVGPAGVEARGDGIKYFFTVDDNETGLKHDAFLRIEGIGVDITIPGNASPENAAVIIKGYLSMRETEYLGDVSITLPKLKMKGGAAMRMQPKKPAWVVDAMLEMSTPIPLGTTGLGIFGFRGLFGYRYVASKSEAGLIAEDSWTDYYLSENPAKGVHINKMAGPPKTDGSKTPVSIGAGLSIATASDEGRAFSIQAFFLLSLPDVILIQGKANVMGERVGLTDGDPPFFALAVFSPGHSIEFAFGADYKERDKKKDGSELSPAKKGRLVSLYAEVRSAYYFEDRDAWFVHFGTQQKPIKAQIAKLFDAYAYLMLSARGIETGAGIHFGFEKKYGPVRATALVYIDLYGNLSFQGAQIGAGLALGGQVDVKVWGVGFGVSVATTLEATLPRPYRVHGSVEVCVYVKVLIKKFEKCIDVEFVWLKDPTKEGEPIAAITTDDLSDLTTKPATKMPVSAMHIGSKRSYPIQYFGSTIPNPSKIEAVIPLDSFVDIQFEKALDGTPVLDIIGGVTNGAHGSIEKVPPKRSYKDTKHSYKVERVQIKTYNTNTQQWVDYHPYQALAGDTFDPSMLTGDSATDIDELKIGFFQKDGKEYNKIRLLAQTPFSYLDNSSGKFVPERMGITGETLFCREKLAQRECLVWENLEEQYPVDKLVKRNNVLINVRKNDGSVRAFKNAFNIDSSLYLPQGSSVELMLPEPALSCHVKLFSFAREVTITFFSLNRDGSPNSFKPEQSYTKTPAELSVPIEYESSLHPGQRKPIEKIVVTDTSLTNTARISEIDRELAEIEAELYVIKANKEFIGKERLEILQRRKRELTGELGKLESGRCAKISDEKPYDVPINNAKAQYEKQLKEIKQQIENLQTTIKLDCDDNGAGCDPRRELVIPKDCLQQMLLLAEKNAGENFELYQQISEIVELSEKFEDQLTAFYEPYAELKEKTNKQCVEQKVKLSELEQKRNSIREKLERLADFSGYMPEEESHDCGTYVHEVCWLSETVVEYQQTIPSQEAIEADYNLSKEAIEKTLQPIWRPKQTYRVELTVSDSVDSENAQESTVYFGFKTKGPIGHFSIPEGEDIFAKLNPEPSNSNFENEAEQAETSLQFYIDDKRSYPYGSILWQKPLYYENPKLKLFFTKPYVQHFFSEWPQYQGLDKLTGRLDILIKDPAEGASQPDNNSPPSHDDSVLGQLPIAKASFKTDDDPIRGQDTVVYDQLRNPERMNPNYQGVGFGNAGGDPEYPDAGCWKSGDDPIVPLSKSLEIEVKHLKPLKLYTAIVRNHYSGADEGEEDKEVLRYNFQTSRFKNFGEHIDSYLLKDKKGNILKAIFDVEIDPSHTGLTDNLFLKRTQEMTINSPHNIHSYTEGLAATYSDPFQRVTEGHFAMQPLHPTSGLEFNFLRLKGKKTDFAILIRSIEPIIDPRIAGDDLFYAIDVVENDALAKGYYSLWSQDRSQVLLMKYSNVIPGKPVSVSSPAVDLKILFANLEWNGREYKPSENAVTENLRGGV